MNHDSDMVTHPTASALRLEDQQLQETNKLIIVFKASPRRRLVVRAFFEPWRRARHDILAYGVALHPKSSPYGVDLL